MTFSHLHNHTQYSLLDGASSISNLYKKAKKDNMPAIAITDHGNMFGVFDFVATAWKDKKQVGTTADGKPIEEPVVKPVVGCEFYLVETRHKKEFKKASGEKDKRFHQLLLAKDEEGYRNLVKLCSIGYLEGMYSKYPRIDKEILLQHHKGLIATTCCLGAEVPQAILRGGEAEGEKVFKWWLDLFGDDYYVEMQRHGIPEQVRVNEVLVKLARKYNVPIIASNDSHYVDVEDYNAHDILLCINTGEKQATPKYADGPDDDENRVKGGRFAFFNDQFFFKDTNQMSQLFSDLPEAIDNTGMIVDKIKPLKLERDIMLPHYAVPDGYDMDSYLEHLTWQGAHKRYNEITPEIEERIKFELFTIRTMGFAGYFLIVQDFINHGKDIGVFVGPGRGSAAGSVVAFCIGITNIDPIKYKLLFERFLNPERKSMPDIDTDFDDLGRQKVIDYVVEKYGKRQVAAIVTYGTMAAKSSIKDVARVMDLPLSESNALAKLVSDKPGINVQLDRLLNAPLRGEGSLEEKEGLSGEDINGAEQLREIFKETDSMRAKVLKEALRLQGTVRGTGVHAAGIIIAPEDITNLLPVATVKDSDLLITQFGGNVIENAGVIKMDFLGLKTLTILRDALALIKRNYGKEIDLDTLPLDDEKTYELYQRGDTNGTFQFESSGMQKYLRDLKPTVFGDLVAMNALYRPGPIAYIPQFVKRKNGLEEIAYDLPEMEEYLEETYGVCVAGDTLVYDATTGQRLRIDQLEDKTGNFHVQGVDEKLMPQKALLTHWVCNGKKPVLKVKLRNGSTVTLTANHKVLTEDGWREIGQLQHGDFIATPRKLDASEVQSFDERKIRVLAYLLADGSITSKGTTADFISKDDVLIEEYKRCLGAFERVEATTLQQVRNVTRVMARGVEKTTYHETNSLVAALREWGLKTTTGGCWSGDKFVPEFVFGLSESQIAFFLASVWDCDGYVGKKHCFVKTISPKLAHDLQTLLLRIGIHATLYESRYFNNRRQQEITAYQVTVYNLKGFARLIAPHLLLKSMQQQAFRSAESADSISRSTFLQEISVAWPGSGRSLMKTHGIDRQHLQNHRNTPRISSCIAVPLTNVLELPQTRRNLQVRWEEIVEIIPAGEELVYDITVAGIHNFVGNNIILHNCVYQEQVMLLSQKLAGFSKGDADVLRKAMGKKQKAVLDKMKGQFIEGAKAKGHDPKKLEKIWTDWEAFAQYAFNKSHSVCYALVAYQTAYLKAHYPAEYMAAVLNNQANIERIKFFMGECQRMNVSVLGPDVNLSIGGFSVDKNGAIRFGMSAVKGAGEAAVEDIIREREEGGAFKNLTDFFCRIDHRKVNKKTLEMLVKAGALDSFKELHRAQFMCVPEGEKMNGLEKLFAFGQQFKAGQEQASNSLFGAVSLTQEVKAPVIPACERWPLAEELENEREVVGIYISAHPLDPFRFEMENLGFTPIADVLEPVKGPPFKIAGFLSDIGHLYTKKGAQFGKATLNDFGGHLEFALFRDDYVKWNKFLNNGQKVVLTACYQEREWGDAGVLELKIQGISLLENARDTSVKAFNVELELVKLNEETARFLMENCEKHPGNAELMFYVVHPDPTRNLKLKTGARKIAISDELLQFLEENEIRYGVELVR